MPGSDTVVSDTIVTYDEISEMQTLIKNELKTKKTLKNNLPNTYELMKEACKLLERLKVEKKH